ncbi:MAG TPA: hypothetical protein VK936_15495 [Longimicrobiales bacterium]|nr:hypothetical protein [Longimicrobiales bacterium]
MSAIGRIVAWSACVGFLAFSAGFFGPIILAPGANQGPLLGIFITGPLGIVAGFATGVWREWRGHTAGPVDVLLRPASRLLGTAEASTLYRAFALVAGIFLAGYGIAGLRRGDGRPAAASIVIAAAILYYAATGRSPAWLRK